jgi:hypothetical protein
MAQFREKTGTRSAFRYLRHPFPDVTAFDSVVREIVLKNPHGCISYMKAGRNHPPIENVREQYTAKFVYEDAKGKQIGSGLDRYSSLEGYRYGIAAVISNMANVSAHGGKARHVPSSDHYSVILKCNDPRSGLFFLSLSREKVTVSSYSDDTVLDRIQNWADGIPALEGGKTTATGVRNRGRPRRRAAGE